MAVMLSRKQRIEGGLIGLLIGDTLGVPYEFHPPQELPSLEEIEFNPPIRFARSHSGTPPGTWSDDGSQTLCLLASLLECGRFDAADFARRLLQWYDEGYMAVDGRVFDIGITTGRAFRELRNGTPPLLAGSLSESANGNGSLMRVLPLALWHQGPDDELIADAQAQSRVTHGHPRSQLCCALYCLWARRLLEEHAAPYQDAVDTLQRHHDNAPPALVELEHFIRPFAAPDMPGSGYVVDCLRSARVAAECDSYEVAVKKAVLMGLDTDTTACVTGGIVGIRDGVDSIPARWRAFLRGESIYRPILDQLLVYSSEHRI
jgi:ADP-ribosyl-[dinitrogen reductase] hydrolase